MIIVCAGDSFTYGMELWEEQYEPGYKDLTDPKIAGPISTNEGIRINQYEDKIKKIIKNRLCLKTDKTLNLILSDVCDIIKNNAEIIVGKIQTERNKLTYVYKLGEYFNCKSINLGRNGSSQIDTIQRTIRKISRLRVLYPNEKIVCVMQNTSIPRVWIGNNKSRNRSLLLSSTEQGQSIEQRLLENEIKMIYMKYIPESLMMTDYFLQILAMQHFCEKNNIQLIQFFATKQHIQLDKKFNNIISESAECILDKKLLGKKYKLPMQHFNCESHNLISDWLIDEMKKRDII